jgi:hypothetical protein
MFEEHAMETGNLVTKLTFCLSHVRILLEEGVQTSLQQTGAIAGLDQSMTDAARSPVADALPDEPRDRVSDKGPRWISPCHMRLRTEITDESRIEKAPAVPDSVIGMKFGNYENVT